MAFASLAFRRWWLFVLLGVVGVGAAYGITSRMAPRYQSTVSLQLNPAARNSLLRYDNTGSLQDAGPTATLAASYTEVLKSRTFGDIVAKKLQLAIPPEAVASAIDTKLVPNTNILRLTISWNQPRDAQQLAQSVAEIFIAQNQQQQATGGSVQDLQDSARQLQTRMVSMRDQRDKLDQTVARGDLSRLTDLNDLNTRLSALETSYANLLVEINQTRSSLDTAAILDNASDPVMVGVPSLMQTLLFGLLAGLGLAAGLAFLLDFLADAVRSPEDLVALTESAPLVAVGHAAGRGPKQGGGARLILVNDAPHTAAAESFRTLKTNLRLAAFENPLRSLVVTSAGAREGKTFVATNLAAALAQAGGRVLLVDADLRRPQVHTAFGVPNGIGLVGALAVGYAHAQNGTGEGDPLFGIVPSGVSNLWCLPAGGTPPNPGDLLSSRTMRNLLAHWANEFDIVVIDTPPLGPVADALPLAVATDAALLVARAGTTRRTALRGALEALRAAGRPALGVVLNDLKAGPLARFGPYSYYYSTYYASDSEPQDKHQPASSVPASPTSHTNGIATPTKEQRADVGERAVG